MIKRYQRSIALVVTFAFLALLPVASMPLPAAQAMSPDEVTMGSADHASNFIEKEQQSSFQSTQKNALPIALGIVALGAGIILLVMLVSKVKYDVTGVWEFHNAYTTAGSTDYDSVWTFTPYDDYNRALGTFSRNANGTITKGRYSVVNKKEVVFQNNDDTEQYLGAFDNKTTMSGVFQITSGALGKWTAKKK